MILIYIFSKEIKFKGAIYLGDTNLKGEMHGKGKMTFNDGLFYEGEWKNNMYLKSKFDEIFFIGDMEKEKNFMSKILNMMEIGKMMKKVVMEFF